MKCENFSVVGTARSKPRSQFAFLLMAVALLAGRGWPQPTENLDVIWTIPTPDSAASRLTPPLVCFGASFASGDVNGDGIPDIIVAGDTYDVNHGTTPMSGRVYIYYGNHVGATTPDLVLKSPVWVGSNTPRLACGDLNGDGYDDIAMGEDMADDGIGVCTIWLGGNPVDTAPAFVIHGRSIWWLNNAFGHGVSIGDVDGDGRADLVVGAYYTAEQPGQQATGRVYVYFGGSGFDTIPDVTLIGRHEGRGEDFGITLSAAGDFDHDGFNDLYIGASDFGLDYRGRVYVCYGGNPMDTSYDVVMTGEVPLQLLGETQPGFLRTRGSFDYGVVGSADWPYGGLSARNCGKVYVHEGGRPMDSIPDICIIGRKDSAKLGLSAQSAGDASGGGNDDLVVGAPGLPPNATGAAYLWRTGSRFDSVPDAWIRGATQQQDIGFVVSTAGDIDGDGRAEFMVSNYPAGDYVEKFVWVCRYTGVGVQEEEALGVRRGMVLRVYPSPCRDRLSIACSAGLVSASLKVWDAAGRLVRRLGGINGQVVSWDLRDDAGRRVGQGVYVIGLEQRNGNALVRSSAKVIVKY